MRRRVNPDIMVLATCDLSNQYLGMHFLVLCLLSFLLGCGPKIKEANSIPAVPKPDPHLNNGVQTRLTREQVLAVASQAASNKGYLLSRYELGRAHFELTKKAGTWTVFFEMPHPTPPGGHFLVWVEDATGKATVMAGE